MNAKTQYPAEQVTFLQAVWDMRQAQRNYFAQPGEYRKKIAITKEQRVDALLKPYITAGLVNTTTPASNQTIMFNT